MKRFSGITSVVVVALGLGAAGCTTAPAPRPEAAAFQPLARPIAALQTRTFDGVSERAVLAAAQASLAQLGYRITWCSPELAALGATRPLVHQAPYEKRDHTLALALFPLALPRLAVQAVKGEELKLLPDSRPWPCLDRLSLTVTRRRFHPQSVVVRVAIQRAIPPHEIAHSSLAERSAYEFCGGGVVPTPEPYHELFTQLAAQLSGARRS